MVHHLGAGFSKETFYWLLQHKGRSQSIAPVTQIEFRRVTKRAATSRSATFPTQYDVTGGFKPANMIPLASTGQRHRCSNLFANGREQLRTVADTKAAWSEHVSTPNPPKEPFAMHFGKMKYLMSKSIRFLFKSFSVVLKVMWAQKQHQPTNPNAVT